MQRRHKYLWMRGKCEWDFTQDGRFDKVMIPRKERKIYKKVKRNYFKRIARKEILEYL